MVLLNSVAVLAVLCYGLAQMFVSACLCVTRSLCVLGSSCAIDCFVSISAKYSDSVERQYKMYFQCIHIAIYSVASSIVRYQLKLRTHVCHFLLLFPFNSHRFHFHCVCAYVQALFSHGHRVLILSEYVEVIDHTCTVRAFYLFVSTIIMSIFAAFTAYQL